MMLAVDVTGSGLRMTRLDEPKDLTRLHEPRDLNAAALLASRVHPARTGLDGAGIVIVVIDYGFDLAHPSLRTAGGETRFAALIDQDGACLQRAKINELLRSCDQAASRDALDRIYDPHAHYFGREGVQVGAHGSWVASIAAGSGTAAFSGVAPKATLVGVQLDLPDRAWREEDDQGRPTWLECVEGGECRGGRPYGAGTDALGDAALAARLAQWDGWRSYEESPAIIKAIEAGYAFARALNPAGIVVNLSIGAWAGGHDPEAPVNRAIDALGTTDQCTTDRCTTHRWRTSDKWRATDEQACEPMVAVVAGTGNAGAEQGHMTGQVSGHVSGDVAARNAMTFACAFAPGNSSQNKLEIWSNCPGGISVEVTAPFANGRTLLTLDGTVCGTVPISLSDGQVIGIGENRGLVRGGLYGVRLLLHPAAVPALLTAGAWLEVSAFDITVRPAQGDQSGRVHAWLERDCNHGPSATLRQTPSLGPRDACPGLVPQGVARERLAHEGLTQEGWAHGRGDGQDEDRGSSIAGRYSLTSIASAASVIAVAGLDNAAAEDRAMALSGRGPRPWPALGGVPTPLLAAPANGLFGARSKSSGYMRGSGTSGAAAIVSGACALAMQAGDLAGRRLDMTEIAQALLGRPIAIASNAISSNDDGPTDGAAPAGWRADLGFGALKFDPSALLNPRHEHRRPTYLRHEEARDERGLSPSN